MAEQQTHDREAAEPSGAPEEAEQAQIPSKEGKTSPDPGESGQDEPKHDKGKESDEEQPDKSAEQPKAAQHVVDEAQKQDTVASEDSQSPAYRWCKIFFEPPDPTAQNFYYMHFDTRETRYDEPTEPYWIWDALTNNVHASGLQQPAVIAPAPTSVPGTSSEPAGPSTPDPAYQGYNPKIHGSYDPNASYAQFHTAQRAEETAIQTYGSVEAAQQVADYAAVGAFNRFSGGFQNTEEKSTDRHDDFNKSGRQMNAFFDVDAAANAHEGKSLKEERRQQKLSKKEIQEMSKKRREKKEKKRMDFYKS